MGVALCLAGGMWIPRRLGRQGLLRALVVIDLVHVHACCPAVATPTGPSAIALFILLGSYGIQRCMGLH
jgi:hypothetical protein